MAKSIRDTGRTLRIIRDTSVTQPLLDPAVIAAAFGAEPTGHKMEEGLAPITRFAVRAEVFGRLQSGGEQTGRTGVAGRAAIPISDTEWKGLERLAALIATPDSAPTAGQVARALLSQAIQKWIAEVAHSPAPDASPHVRELAALVGV